MLRTKQNTKKAPSRSEVERVRLFLKKKSYNLKREELDERFPFTPRTAPGRVGLF
jgi:hypothetical protein